MSLEAVGQESALRLAKPSEGAKIENVVGAASRAATDAVDKGLHGDDVLAAIQDAVEQAKVQSAPTVTPSPLAILVKYIPTETITLYVAVQAALGEVQPPQGHDISDANYVARWVWLGVMLLMTVLLTLGFAYRAQLEPYKDKAPSERPGNWFRWPAFELFATSTAFVVWALALPQTPLQDFDWYDYSAWNSVLVLGGTVVIGASAYVLNKTVSWTKVADSPH